jgi:predicted O-methyltransferase YrrM
MEFMYKWHESVMPVWDDIFEHMDGMGHPLRDYLEVGSFDGASACHAIAEIGKRGGTVTCVDPWDPDYPSTIGEDTSRDFDMRAVLKRFRANTEQARNEATNFVGVNVHDVKSEIALSELVSNMDMFDFIYIDGSHHAADVLLDGLMAWKLLRPGGVMVFDDYLWATGGKYNPLECPKYAVDTFVTLHMDQLLMLPYRTRQVYLMKRIG